jgi:hypothetical protein
MWTNCWTRLNVAVTKACDAVSFVKNIVSRLHETEERKVLTVARIAKIKITLWEGSGSHSWISRYRSIPKQRPLRLSGNGLVENVRHDGVPVDSKSSTLAQVRQDPTQMLGNDNVMRRIASQCGIHEYAKRELDRKHIELAKAGKA